MGQAREIRRELVADGKYIKFENIIWEDKFGNEKIWESLERKVDGAEAVLIIPWISETKELIIIKQYRPPAKGYVYELPAGLIDAGEDPVQAAKRELREETGYEGEVVSLLDPAFNTPGMSGEAVYSAYMDVPRDQTPHMDLQESEDIEVIFLKREEIESFVIDEHKKKSKFDSKLLMYLSGIVTENKLENNSDSFINDLHNVNS